MKKLIGNTEIEDSLEKLDKLTVEEARMASAELLEITHRVDDRVKGVEGSVRDVQGNVQVVDSRVQGVDNRVQGVDNRIQGVDNTLQGISNDVRDVDDKLDQVNRSLSLYHLAIVSIAQTLTGNQLRDNLLRWLSPSDPSTNHNIASKAHHNGTAQWFLEGSIFNQWKSTDPFLWLHGKRA